MSRGALAAIGATLLCASCLPSGSVEYGTAIVTTGGQTGHDSGQTGGDGGQSDSGPGGAGGTGGAEK